MSLSYGTAYFANTIVYQNDGMYSDDVYLDWGGFAEIHYCNMPMPLGGTGGNNMNVDPEFVDAGNGDFRLAESSLCIDAGTDYIFLGGRVLVDLDPDEYCDAAPDIGAREYCAVTGASEEPLTVFKLDQNHPNPFNTRTSIGYNLAADSFVSAKVYNVKGQEVRTLINTHQPAGRNSVFWNGRDNQGQRQSQGVYFLRLHAGGEVSSVRMLLLK